eukprot:4921497-Lingulodinium_polyedra.AAC.1
MAKEPAGTPWGFWRSWQSGAPCKEYRCNGARNASRGGAKSRGLPLSTFTSRLLRSLQCCLLQYT